MRRFLSLLFLVLPIAAAQQQCPQPEKGAEKIAVTLTSDFQTWVSIPRILQPKKFHELTVMLPPGEYDVIGRRKGYSEVWRKLQVSRGEARIKLHVACEGRE